MESTELALAFQLGSDVTGSDVMFQPQKQPVFAYLPLRSFGFRFIVQGETFAMYDFSCYNLELNLTYAFYT